MSTVLLDTSAVIAILQREMEASALLIVLGQADRRLIGAPTLVEAAAVLLARKGAAGEVALDAFLERMSVEVVPMSPAAAAHARSAYRRFGKGVGMPGVLNYGDCLSYGLAMELGIPLLCKGNDFVRTDVIVTM